MGLNSWLLLLTLGIIWGGSFYFVGVAVTQVPPLTIVWIRVGLAALTLWAILLIFNIPNPKSTKTWLALMGMGLLNNAIPFSLIVWGQTQIESGLASILNATTPIFTVLIAGLLLSDEKFSTIKIAGVLLGFAGTIILIGPDVLSNADGNLLPKLAVLGAALSYGFAAVFGRRFKTLGIHPIATAAGQVTASAILLAPVVIVLEQPFSLPMPSMQVWFSLVALAIICTAFAYILYFKILSSSGATNLSLVTLIVPVSAILLGYFFLNERLSGTQLLGMTVIGLGLIVMDGRLLKHMKKN